MATKARAGKPRPEKTARVAGLLFDLYPRLVQKLREGMDPKQPGELTIAQCRILSHLYGEPASNKALAEQAGVSVAATSRMIDGLVERGFVERQRDELDGRACLLRITAAGRRRFLAFRDKAVGVLRAPLAELATDELGTTSEILERLLEVFPGPSAGAR